MAGEARGGRTEPHDVATGLTEYHAKLLALELARRSASDSVERQVGVLFAFPMTTKVETEMVAGGTVHAIAGALMLACLDLVLTLELIRAMADLKPECVVRLDAGFKNNDQINADAVLTFSQRASSNS